MGIALMVGVLAMHRLGSASIEGVILDYRTNGPVAGLKINVLGKTVLTDQAGHFLFEGLIDGQVVQVKILAEENAKFPYAALGDSTRNVRAGDHSIQILLRDSTFRMMQVGDKIPPMDFQGWANTKPLTSSVLSGKVVLFDFWFIECTPCRAAFPSLKALASKYGDKIVLIGVHTKSHTISEVQAFAKKFELTYPLAVDKGGVAGFFTDAFVTSGFPTLALVGADGKVAGLPKSVAEADAAIEGMLKSKGLTRRCGAQTWQDCQ